MTSSKSRYIKKDPIEHIMLRPDMYIGSTTIKKSEEYIAQKVDDKYRIYKKDISVSPGIIRVFIEALSNAVDNVVRSKNTKTKCTKIKVDFDRETGLTSILNDGDIIPIELNEDNQCYNHSLIFGHLLTGSNYDDTEDRFTSGKNGLGVKLLNVFSTQFNVEGLDPQNGKILKQTWTNNMRITEGPVITNTKIKKGYTKISWIPDFTLFKIENYTEDILSLYTRFVIDSSMMTKINVYINDELIPVSSLQTYASIYSSPTEESLSIKMPNSEVVLCTSEEDFQHISFANGISTKLGGVHVDAWSEAIFRPIVDKFNATKAKTAQTKPKININDVKQFFKLFVNSTVVRPEFDGQSKNKLESPTIEAEIKKTQITAICKWSIMSKIEDIIRSKEFSVLKKSESKRKKIIKIDGLDHANLAGSKNSKDCTLILCEGLSAKTYAVAGIQKGVYGKAGRDWFGIYPLTGKLMNVRNFTPTSIASNKVITNLIQTIGLRYDTNYLDETNYESLNYGKIMVMTDADVDGCHIEGLLINFFHYLFPTLLQREQPFLVSMKTPIVRVFVPKGEDILFYDEKRFQKWFSEQNKKVKTKYYKGLGTTRPEDVPDTFGLKMVEYIKDVDIDINMSKVFSKKESDMRKEWLSDYSIENHPFSLDDQGEISRMELSSFINGELIKFSIADCSRSIPNFIDGLKESQRKILYAVKKRNLRYSGQSLKVAQLSGYTAEHSNYHHGEQNLCDTIIGLANEFPGTNNIPLLYRDGMFGTRLEGGSDSASPRYIYTKMEYLTEYIFREEDEALLTQVNDDGDLVQPEFYIPILPMILVNGCNAGIGTGWSCNIPCFNPIEIIDGIKDWLNNNTEEENGERKENVSVLPNLIPWYRGFKGTIEADESKVKRYITKGIIEENKNGFEISELPINMWTNKFKEYCEDLQEEKKLKTMKNYSTPNEVKFILTNGNEFECSIENLKLHSYLYTSNMVLFDDKNKIKKYESVYEILNNFCVIRYKYYHLRKEYQLRQLVIELKMLQNKERFVSEVMDDILDIMKKKESVIVENLKTRNYDEDLKKENGGYEYLLGMQVRSFTEEKVNTLRNDIQILVNKIETLKNITEKQLWINDLNEFKIKYDEWLVIMDEAEKPKAKKKSTLQSKKRLEKVTTTTTTSKTTIESTTKSRKPKVNK
jgi:DNA topoisomerase-2